MKTEDVGPSATWVVKQILLKDFIVISLPLNEWRTNAFAYMISIVK